ncbi:phosphoglycerate dehydrogenase [Desulfofalx alkaliphila]|uniref:phosphoglycerate dehydrogenase n=1 Tax=Desulfofalx alkaliphila TaxID=105483 RepID=UPI0004E14763|nr:phosphoglycerate dehydrogenase [Desulfofalx alkaliphila]
MKVLALDGVSEKGLAALYEIPDITVDIIKDKMTEEELIKIIGDYDAMIVRSATKVTPNLLEHATKLKVVGRAGVGVDNIDLKAATNKGVIVVNAPDGNTIAAAEHTIAMMLALARKIPAATAKLREGVWDRKSFLGVELRNKVLGVIGMGRIGSAVAKRAMAMDMKILAYDPYISDKSAADKGLELVTLDEIYKEADFITMHMPLTKETRHMIDADAIAKMKDGVRIINCARGGIIDEEALYEGLKSGKVAGAALDVFEKEPNTDSPLYQFENFIATPHLGASTIEAQVNVAVDVAKEIADYLQGNMVRNAVNIPSLTPKLLAKVRPFLDLGEKLGKFQAQLLTGRIKSVEVVYGGEVAKYDVTPITTMFLKGLLDPILQETVNFVNASVVARDRGIRVIQTTQDQDQNYSNLMTVKVTTDQTERLLSGTLFLNNDPRVVDIDGYRIDAVPQGNMLVIPHIDRPGIIGKVGTVLGEHNINIAGMQVGRKEQGGSAVMVLAVDTATCEATIKQIADIDGILDVKLVSIEN